MTTRRDFVGGALAAGVALGVSYRARAAVSELPFWIAARSPWMANGVALTRRNQLFLSLPRFPGHMDTPSLAHRKRDGSVVAFPGNSWNDWTPGGDATSAFVYVNSVHIFADDTVWCVDQGALREEEPAPLAQKLVQIDPESGKILKILRFDRSITPPGSKMNDIRFYGDLMYITDSGLGGIIVHDLSSGKTIRRLSGYKQLLATPEAHPAPPKPGQGKIRHVTPKSDLIEISPDGAWLYWASPTGPFWRIRTDALRDPHLNDDALAARIEKAFDTPLVGGSAMDTLGNLYITDMARQRVLVHAPDGREAVLASSTQFISPDAPFISADRHLYVPIPQTQRTSLFGHPDETQRPFITVAMALPKTFQGITLGDAITGVSKR